MNADTVRQHAKIMTAWADGRPLQVRRRQEEGVQGPNEGWEDSGASPSFNWIVYEYRVKPDATAADQKTFYVGVTKREITTNYVVFVDSAQAESYPCDTMLTVQVIDSRPGART